MAKISLPRGGRSRIPSCGAVGILLFGLLGACLFTALGATPAGAHSPGTFEFAAGSMPLLADAQGTALGTVTPGTPLMVIKQASGLAEVRIDGWSMVGAEQIVFAAKGQRIILARLTANRPANRTVGARSQDQYGNAWEQVVVTGWMSSSGLVAAVAPIWKEAHDLFATRCATCHELHKPTEFTANQWPHVLGIMTKRAMLTPDQTVLVTKYLQTHARPISGPSSGSGAGNGQSR